MGKGHPVGKNKVFGEALEVKTFLGSKLPIPILTQYYRHIMTTGTHISRQGGAYMGFALPDRLPSPLVNGVIRGDVPDQLVIERSLVVIEETPVTDGVIKETGYCRGQPLFHGEPERAIIADLPRVKADGEYSLPVLRDIRVIHGIHHLVTNDIPQFRQRVMDNLKRPSIVM